MKAHSPVRKIYTRSGVYVQGSPEYIGENDVHLVRPQKPYGVEDGRQALCGNGAYNMHWTLEIGKATCHRCINRKH